MHYPITAAHHLNCITEQFNLKFSKAECNYDSDNQEFWEKRKHWLEGVKHPSQALKITQIWSMSETLKGWTLNWLFLHMIQKHQSGRPLRMVLPGSRVHTRGYHPATLLVRCTYNVGPIWLHQSWFLGWPNCTTHIMWRQYLTATDPVGP